MASPRRCETHILPRRKKNTQPERLKKKNWYCYIQVVIVRFRLRQDHGGIFTALWNRMPVGRSLWSASASLPIPDGSATWPTCQRTTRVHSSVEHSRYYLLCLSISRLIFFCMNSSLACADILIPPPNPPPTYLSQRTHQKLVQSFPLPLLPFPHPALITKDTVIIAGGSEGQKEGTRLQKHKPRQMNVYPHKWALAHNYEARQRHLVNSSDGFDGLRVYFPLSATCCCVCERSWLRRWTDWGGILCVAAGSRGSALQSLPSHHILKSFSSQVLGKALLIHAVLSGQSWHMWGEQLCGLASLTLFCSSAWMLLKRKKKKTVFIPFSVSPSQSSVLLQDFCIFGSRLKHCFINPLEFWSKQLFFFLLILILSV